ncbi:MAG: endolytic transglycosylase MltG [Candidatus Saganbacteria bacterium]|nr:endolytic transglycosylase MltG [Candidatus Saganbacteria bacterium]
MKQTVLIVITISIFLVVGIGLFFDAPQSSDQLVNVYISSGSTSSQIAELLFDKGIINNRTVFLALNRILRTEGKLKAGLYCFKPGMPLFEVAYKLKKGETEFEGIRAIFPEGTSIYKMGIILKEAGYEDWQGFQEINLGDVSAVKEKYPFLASIPINSLEGYLYPDTYFIDPKASPNDVAEVMLARFQDQIFSFWQFRQGRQVHQGSSSLSLHQLLILASIVEKEAKLPQERPIIASVFYNRLKIGMPLAADPTIKYALERPTKKVYYNQLEVRSPYNTYKRYGLPPGPICNPGLEAFKAVLYPAQTDFLFFVAKSDGSHIFSKTWEEHQKARQDIKNKT